MKPKILAAFVVTLTSVSALMAAFVAGSAAYTKRVETALLSEPQMLATPVAKLAYAKKVKVEEIKGSWVRVSEGKSAGWVFAGNLVEQQPSETRGLDGLPLPAAETTATAAARPLVPAAEEYATRHGLAKPAEDLTWLAEQKAAITPEAVQAFLQEQKKGEYR